MPIRESEGQWCKSIFPSMPMAAVNCSDLPVRPRRLRTALRRLRVICSGSSPVICWRPETG